MHRSELELVAELFKALTSPARLAIIRRLAEHEACVHELVEVTGLSQSLVSQHLRVLRGARLVHGERDGKEVRYSLMDEHVAHVVDDAISHVSEPLRGGEPGDVEQPGDEHEESVSHHKKGA
ncbi:metalloregulator ArsR/SmtB family transcription factor [Phytoactinopolyspora sp. XMNu-373]|uniref:Metalloregulator ArsR/SmtB family transcription factor n=1 Tax=Phytoactinopolyspora mesophila TaxID=2650750 RepID=A0A7K3LXR3_9ACTN|nr:metalloregulator ArsR/SmtB family transcription factor [Phytoactinopolyspora mesophila]NDL55824.1 metalloregulator ArsR/SmtB family transcription factor [Phytoactinopolyspora mesophila]